MQANWPADPDHPLAVPRRPLVAAPNELLDWILRRIKMLANAADSVRA